MVNFKVASFSRFQDCLTRFFCDGEVGLGDGSGGMNAICSRNEEADDVISDEGASTNFALLIVCYRKSQSAICVDLMRRRP